MDGLATYFKCKREVKIDTILTLRGTFDNRVPDPGITCEINYINLVIRYTPHDTDLCLGVLRRWGIHLVK